MDQGLVTLSITAQRRLRQEGQDQAQDQLRLHRKSTKKKKKKDVCDHVIMERFFFSFKKKDLFIFTCACFACTDVCVLCSYLLPAHRGQKVLDPKELEFQMV